MRKLRCQINEVRIKMADYDNDSSENFRQQERWHQFFGQNVAMKNKNKEKHGLLI